MSASSPRPTGEPITGSRLAGHGLLLLATLCTTTLKGALDAQQGATGGIWASLLALGGVEILRGLLFSVPLCAILLTHEMGHYLAARYHRVDVSLPYFLPVPPMIGIGTLGAFIRIRSPIPSRAALLDIGIAGPLAGLALALPILIVGLLQSQVVVHDFSAGKVVMQEGQSLLYGLFKLAIFGEWLPAMGGMRDVNIHPMAYAGWVGLLLTMLNLMPIAQLDGGHILYALIGERHHVVTDWLHRALFLLAGVVIVTVAAGEASRGLSAAFWRGVQAGLPWVVFGGVVALMRRLGDPYHPPVGVGADGGDTAEGEPGPAGEQGAARSRAVSDPDADRPLGPWRRRLAILALIILGLLFMPTPMRLIGG